LVSKNTIQKNICLTVKLTYIQLLNDVHFQKRLMGTSERKQREKELRLNCIINSAQKVFFTKGLMDSTIDDVAVSAEISKGTIYLYFKNKEELIAAVFIRGIVILRELLKKKSSGKKSGIEKIAAMGKAYLEFAKKYPDYFGLMLNKDLHRLEVNDTTPHSKLCIDQGVAILQMVSEAVVSGIKDGSIRKDLDPLQSSLILWGQIHGTIALAFQEKSHLLEQFSIDFDKMILGSINIIIEGLKNRVLK
jgi:AcrR family transcriptional regulator